MIEYLDAFLICLYFFTLAALFWKKEKIDTILDFSLHKRAFSAVALFFTIIATMIGGTGFVKKLNLFYTDGWLYLIPNLGVVIQMLIFCLFIIPRAEKILGYPTVSSFIGAHYGQKMRWIAAMSSSIGVSGFIASQCKVMGMTGHAFIPIIPENIINFMTLLLITFYCYNGGIRHVIITDILQALCFFVTFISLLYYLWPNPEQAINITQTHDLTKYSFFTAFNNASIEEIQSMLLLLFYFAIPIFTSSQFQRIAIARNKSQLYKSWWASTFFMFFATIIPCYISYYVFLQNPDLSQNQVLSYVINLLDVPGLKAITIIGIFAMAMSTIDSHINTAACNLANDFIKMNSLSAMEKVTWARVYTIIIALFSYGLMLLEGNFLRLVLLASSFYMPIITLPLFAAIFDIKLTERNVISSAIITFSVTLVAQILKYNNIIIMDPLMPCFLLNLTLLTFNYFIDKYILFINTKSS
ncbi:MAG: sodium:solute symporter family protein [Rickettsiaceae bacterium]